MLHIIQKRTWFGFWRFRVWFYEEKVRTLQLLCTDLSSYTQEKYHKMRCRRERRVLRECRRDICLQLASVPLGTGRTSLSKLMDRIEDYYFVTK